MPSAILPATTRSVVVPLQITTVLFSACPTRTAISHSVLSRLKSSTLGFPSLDCRLAVDGRQGRGRMHGSEPGKEVGEGVTMDAQQFDRLTKAFGSAWSRRQAFGRLAGMAVAGLLVALVEELRLTAEAVGRDHPV